MTDAERIRKLGGPAAVAKLMEQSSGRRVSVQRVQNWLARGIPAAVKLEFPSLFWAPLADAVGAGDPRDVR